MDLKDQLKNLFPDHQESEEPVEENSGLWISDDTVECHFVKRNGKPHTILKGYTGHKEDFKELARELKKYLGVGGTEKNDEIILQGDYRDKIMKYLKERGFKVKRVGG